MGLHTTVGVWVKPTNLKPQSQSPTKCWSTISNPYRHRRRLVYCVGIGVLVLKMTASVRAFKWYVAHTEPMSTHMSIHMSTHMSIVPQLHNIHRGLVQPLRRARTHETPHHDRHTDRAVPLRHPRYPHALTILFIKTNMLPPT